MGDRCEAVRWADVAERREVRLAIEVGTASVRRSRRFLVGRPIGLQLHWIAAPWADTTAGQEVQFRGLLIVDDPVVPTLLTCDNGSADVEVDHKEGSG